MPRYNVKVEKDDKEYWCCYSSIVDFFITPLLSKKDYEHWRLEEYGKANFKPVEECNQMKLVDALFSLSLVHNAEEVVENLREVGIFSEFYPGHYEDTDS